MSERVGSSVGSARLNPGPGSRFADILGWSFYLACSWTWCIGMFLPVLLIRDYGPWGFVVFAVPNVIGAAAMGWVLRRPGHSERLTAAHRTMVSAFSLVTSLFQLFFFLWISRSTPAPADYAFLVCLLLFIPAIAISRTPRHHVLLITSAAVWVASAAAMVVLITRGDVNPPAITSPPRGLLWLAPVCLMGFALCPYLDATFHLARRRQQPGPAALSFALGFGVLFLAMILFTLLYARLFDTAQPMIAWASAPPLTIALVFGHISLQLFFTIIVHGHARQRLEQPLPESLPSPGWRHGLALGLMIAVFSAGLAMHGRHLHAGLSYAEITYRLFMSFYGLVFPAYVWLCMMPTWRAPRPPTARHIAVWAGACLIAAPMYWMGFIERQEVWLLPGLVAVLLARAVIPRGDPAPDSPSGAPAPAPTRPPTLAAAATAGPDHPAS